MYMQHITLGEHIEGGTKRRPLFCALNNPLAPTSRTSPWGSTQLEKSWNEGLQAERERESDKAIEEEEKIQWGKRTRGRDREDNVKVERPENLCSLWYAISSSQLSYHSWPLDNIVIDNKVYQHIYCSSYCNIMNEAKALKWHKQVFGTILLCLLAQSRLRLSRTTSVLKKFCFGANWSTTRFMICLRGFFHNFR